MKSLKGIKVIEMAGLAPGPFCGMLLRDFGATVIRVDKLNNYTGVDALSRGKKAIAIDLKAEQGQRMVRRMCSQADVLIDPFRPGVLEKLNLNPNDLMRDNHKLIVARLTGYGQSGPMSQVAGHDINYLSLTGLLSMFVSSCNSKPVPPINILGDFAGGGLLCAFGICLALLERCSTGKGKILDASITEGTNYLASWIHKSRQKSYQMQSIVWPNLKQNASNLLDGGSAFYNCYPTLDGKYMALGAIEPQFWAKFKQILIDNLDPNVVNFDLNDMNQFDDDLKSKLNQIFVLKTRDQWTQMLLHQDACCTPVLELHESIDFEHFVHRKSFNSDQSPGVFPRTTDEPDQHWSDNARDPISVDEHTLEVLQQEFNFEKPEIEQLIKQRIITGQCKL